MKEIIITNLQGAWKLVYRDNGIDRPGFYSKNAGDPPAYVPAPKDVIFKALDALVNGYSA